MRSIRTMLATAVLVSLTSAPAQAVTWSGEGGWEVQYTGFINLFYNQLDFDYTNGGSKDSALLNEGLLPSFHTMKAKSPTVNGLTGTSQITFAVDTSTNKNINLNKGGPGEDTLIDLREVFFNVEGHFGTISVGRTLALYQRQSILKDMTLFGVGAVADPASNGTGLGRIGIGYVYPDFRARFLWQSPDMHGFQGSLGVFQPRETLSVPGADFETDIPMFQGEFTYNGAMGIGNVSAWAGFLWQETTVRLPGAAEVTAATAGTVAGGRVVLADRAAAEAIAASEHDLNSAGWNIGAEVGAGGFALLGTYYQGEGLGTLFTQQSLACTATICSEAENDGGYVQGTYTIPGSGDSKTKLGISWGYSEQKDEPGVNLGEVRNEGYSVGVYHDVNSWLKVIAEYNDYDLEVLAREVNGFSVGAFMFW